MPLVAIDRVSLAFGHLPLLEDATLRIERGERVSVVGRNGAGKSTLLRIVSGEQSPDSGTVWTEPRLRRARLEQDVPLSTDRTVFDVVADGLGDLSDLVAGYHHAAVRVAEGSTPALIEKLGRLQHELDELDGWRIEQRVELVLSRLDLPSDVRGGLYALALLCQRLWKTGLSVREQVALFQAFERGGQNFGLSPMDRRRLQWQIDQGERDKLAKKG